MGDDLVRVGSELRHLREARGWGLREFAGMAQVNAGDLSRVENGKLRPTARMVARIGRVIPAVLGLFSQGQLQLDPSTAERSTIPDLLAYLARAARRPEEWRVFALPMEGGFVVLPQGRVLSAG